MTQEHPITPPPELVREWIAEIWHEGTPVRVAASDLHIATQAARWGADQQLAKDAKWLDYNALSETHLKVIPVGESLKEAMRPKPPSLKDKLKGALYNENLGEALRLVEQLDDSL